MKKRIVSLALSMVMVIALVPFTTPAVASDADFVITSGTLVAYNGNSANVIIPSTVYYIADDVFSGKAFIKSVTFPDTVTSIGRRAFENCTGLTAVKIPNHVKLISTAAFSGCTSLSSVTLHPYLVTIGAEAFENCPITSISLPYSLKTIGISAFKDSKLTSVHIPGSVTAIGDFAFTSKNGTPAISGVTGSKAESLASTFGHKFSNTPDAPPPAPPALPELNLPPKLIKEDPKTKLPGYSGPKEAPASWANQQPPKLVYSGIGKHPKGNIDEAYFSSPVVIDIDKDGKPEIIFTNYSTYCVDAKTGAIKWQAPSGYGKNAAAGTKPLGRSFSDVIVMDIDGDGELEIITGHSVMYDEKGNALSQNQYKGILSVYDKNGSLKPGWPKNLPRTINSVAVHDLNGNGKLEIVVGLVGETAADIIWAFDSKGNVLDGWPQLNASSNANTNTNRNDNTGYLYGLQNNTIAIGDIDGSGKPSIIVPTDLVHISAFDASGKLKKANPIFGGRSWGRIGVWEDYEYEKKVENEGFGFRNQVWSAEANGMIRVPWKDVPTAKRNYANFMNNSALITDVDGDGINEIVVIGTIYDAAFPYPELPLYEVPFIFNGDRTRFNKNGFDWTTVPKNAAPILTNDYRETILSQIAPSVADLDGNGVKDILWNSMSGKVMCYSLDKKSSWSFWVNDKDEHTMEFASPLAIADINGDGFKEVIFGTNTPYDSKRNGRLIVLGFNGKKIIDIELPKAIGSDMTNGVVARPVIADLDGDGKPYIILNTYLSGLTVYKMP